MEDEIKEGLEQEVSEPKGEAQEEPKIELTADQYEQLLDRIDELQGQLERRGAKDYSIDDLAEEAKRQQPPPRRQGPPRDYDEMTNRELVEYIVQEVNQQLSEQAMPIVRDVEEMKLRLEINKCEAKYPDFWDYKNEIHRLGTLRPHLSIEDAYLIASGQKRASAKDEPKEGDQPKKRSAMIHNLPPRPTYSGEKPSGSIPSGSVGKAEPETIKDAASLAWDKVVGKDQEKI